MFVVKGIARSPERQVEFEEVVMSQWEGRQQEKFKIICNYSYA